jgi:hypothetical protein
MYETILLMLQRVTKNHDVPNVLGSPPLWCRPKATTVHIGRISPIPEGVGAICHRCHRCPPRQNGMEWKGNVRQPFLPFSAARWNHQHCRRLCSRHASAAFLPPLSASSNSSASAFRRPDEENTPSNFLAASDRACRQCLRQPSTRRSAAPVHGA